MRKGREGTAEEECGNFNDGADCENGKPVCVVFAVEVQDGVVESDGTANACASAMVNFTSSPMVERTYRNAAPKMAETANFFLMLMCRRETT